MQNVRLARRHTSRERQTAPITFRIDNFDIMLDQRLPSRLLTAFPEGVAVERLGLAACVDAVADFLKS